MRACSLLLIEISLFPLISYYFYLWSEFLLLCYIVLLYCYFLVAKLFLFCLWIFIVFFSSSTWRLLEFSLIFLIKKIKVTKEDTLHVFQIRDLLFYQDFPKQIFSNCRSNDISPALLLLYSFSHIPNICSALEHDWKWACVQEDS